MGLTGSALVEAAIKAAAAWSPLVASPLRGLGRTLPPRAAPPRCRKSGGQVAPKWRPSGGIQAPAPPPLSRQRVTTQRLLCQSYRGPKDCQLMRTLLHVPTLIAIPIVVNILVCSQNLVLAETSLMIVYLRNKFFFALAVISDSLYAQLLN